MAVASVLHVSVFVHFGVFALVLHMAIVRVSAVTYSEHLTTSSVLLWIVAGWIGSVAGWIRSVAGWIRSAAGWIRSITGWFGPITGWFGPIVRWFRPVLPVCPRYAR